MRKNARILEMVQRIADKVGMSVVPSWRLPRLPQSRYIARVVRDWEVTGIVDVGANEGQYRDFLRGEVAYTGPIVSVEPIPHHAAANLMRSADDSNWRVEEVALGATTGNAEFRVMRGSEFSSFLTPEKSMASEFDGQSHVAGVIPVRVDTLDALLERHHDFLGPRVYLKMDTQGFDIEVLKGLRSRRKQVIALQSEASVKAIYESMPSYHDTIMAVEALGFSVSQFFPNNDGHFPLLYEFDCHFVDVAARRDPAPLGEC